ncbi:hypothetical protein PTRG_04864 [Pyrenophora tritici-repentis Pt-1C-BFP]|uniref:Uncharacterized protein n=1 Tax=Pyrenophora tritici-repentis (strain Pt-1C-BFP) TaxID=426418 RepID=B2W5G4_PYRTR|nr:uncharacterized protein PTRG_04864 [Pyrenophora tritici-repentis Pt-1C-BFP]EDU47771.1 hypothetical protein PTRG_04864 [Pyrenophora tritici-repentis Pt-1C-BFP]
MLRLLSPTVQDICGQCYEAGPKVISFVCPTDTKNKLECSVTCFANNVQRQDRLCCKVAACP